MAFVNHDKIIISPVQQCEVKAIAFTLLTAEVGVEEHIITKTVFLQRIILVVALVGIPVVV